MTRRRLGIAFAAVLAALVIIVPLVIGLSSRPALKASATAAPEPLATVSPSPNEDSDAVPIFGEELVLPGQTLTIAALDASGVWGAIDLTRGQDTGGYSHYAVGTDVFVIEIRVEYRAERVPHVDESGYVDWTLTTVAGADPVGRQLLAMPPNPDDWDWYRQPLVTGYSTLVDVLTVPVRGTLYFEVPRVAADDRLVLLYRPENFPTGVIGISVREPGRAPDHVPAATAVPTPRPLTYVSRSGLPFTVIDSPTADALFDAPDSCINLEDGYRVTYPASWYTNIQVGEVPPCTWFGPVDFLAPTLFAVRPEFQPPEGVAIIVMGIEGGYGGGVFISTYGVDEVITIGGYDGQRRELVGECLGPEGCHTVPPNYTYDANRGEPGQMGPWLVATTSSEWVADYELSKAVLDRIMASIEFLP